MSGEREDAIAILEEGEIECSVIGEEVRRWAAALAWLHSLPDTALTDAARLRSLAATFDSHPNRDHTYTGAQVAAMLRDGGE